MSELANLTLLGLDDNQIWDVSPLAGLTALEFLYLESNVISNIAPLGGLVNLTDLYLDDNLIVNVDALEDLDNLNYVRLRNNDIESLGGGPWGDSGLMANDGLDAGDEVLLDGNPLRAWALCEAIPRRRC